MQILPNLRRRELILVLRTRNMLSKCGLADLTVLEAAQQVRRVFAEGQGGLRRYVFAVLGGTANVPAGEVVLKEGDTSVSVPDQWLNEPLVDFLEAAYRSPVELPHSVDHGTRTFHL